MHAVYVVLVGHGLYLVVAHVVDHAYLLARLYVLAEVYVEGSHLAVDGGAHLELGLALTHELKILTHVVEVLGHLRGLCRAVACVLHYALVYEGVLLACQVVVLLGLEVVLTRHELLLVERSHVIGGTVLAFYLHVLLE